MRQIRKLALIAVALATGLVGASSVQASDCHYSKPAYTTITVYQPVKVPHVSYVTKFAPCGTPYRAKIVTYSYVQMPVQKQVRTGW